MIRSFIHHGSSLPPGYACAAIDPPDDCEDCSCGHEWESHIAKQGKHPCDIMDCDCSDFDPINRREEARLERGDMLYDMRSGN